MRNKVIYSLLPGLIVFLTGCMKWDYDAESVSFDLPEHGLFIINEGNFQYGNSSLSFYEPDNMAVENELFFKANGMKLGDVAQSMTVYGNMGWIVVNNSHVIFAVDLTTLKEKGRIENMTSPRYIHFVSDYKAYVTQIWDNRIAIVNPQRYVVTGYIDVPDMAMGSGSTEQMVQLGKYVYCNCWSYQNRIIKIDTDTDEVVASLEVGLQPNSIVLDCNDKLWAITDGGYEGSGYGYETPALVRIDTESLTVEKRFMFKSGDTPGEIKINGTGDLLYWINDDIWSMSIDSQRLPSIPLIDDKATEFYGLTISPTSGDVYVADAIDYQQQGVVYRYSATGAYIDEFYVGVNPGAFAWK